MVSQGRRGSITPRLNTTWVSATQTAKVWRRIKWRQVKWYRKAAEQNLAEAQRTLGIYYDNGNRRRKGSGRGGEMVSQSRRAK